MNVGGGYSLDGLTKDSPDRVVAFFKDELPENGWTETDPSENPDEGVYIEYKKDQRTLVVYAFVQERIGMTILVVGDLPAQAQ